jgi:hypothetical protein
MHLISGAGNSNLHMCLIEHLGQEKFEAGTYGLHKILDLQGSNFSVDKHALLVMLLQFFLFMIFYFFN